MNTKYQDIISSPTFHLIVVVLALQILKILNIINDGQASELATTFQVFLGSIAGIRASARIGSEKPNATTVSIPEGVSTVSATTKVSKKKA